MFQKVDLLFGYTGEIGKLLLGKQMVDAEAPGFRSQRWFFRRR